jgi:paraquat-inducible protein A
VIEPIGKKTFQPALALSVAGLFALFLANIKPVLTFDVAGREQAGYLFTGVRELLHQGYWMIAILVFFASIFAPALYLAAVAYVSAACAFRLRLPQVSLCYNITDWAEPWNLIPVYSIATVVSVVKLRMIGGVTWNDGARWVLCVAVLTLIAQQVFDRRLVEHRLEAMGALGGSKRVGMMSDSFRVSTARALVTTAALLYIPSNIIPVMTMTVAGKTDPLTVLGGVKELWDSNLPAIAGVVFLASFVVPFLKVISLSWILWLHGTDLHQSTRNSIHRIVHRIGSWSMIDIFLLAVLSAVGQLGALGSVIANPGAIYFCGVMICCLFAAEIYKPRLIWESHGEPTT